MPHTSPNPPWSGRNMASNIASNSFVFVSLGGVRLRLRTVTVVRFDVNVHGLRRNELNAEQAEASDI